MSDVVKAAIVQTAWTGDKESMIELHERYARRGRRPGRPGHVLPGAVLRPVLLPGAGRRVLQLHRGDPRRSHHQAVPGARRRSTAWCWCCRCTRRSSPASSTTPPRSSTPTAPTSASTARPTSPRCKGFWEKFYFRPGNLGYPVFDTAVGKVGVYICYDRHFPEGWRALGLNGAQIVFNPSATSRGLSAYLWQLEQTASAAANMYFVGAINRVGIETPRRQRLLRHVVLRRTPAASSSTAPASDTDEELVVRDLDLDLDRRGPGPVGLLPRPPTRHVRPSPRPDRLTGTTQEHTR